MYAASTCGGRLASSSDSPTLISCFAASALLLVLFVVVERRAADPLLDLSLFRKPAFTGATIVGFALSASIFSMFLYITLFFQNVLGFSPFEAGLRSLLVTGPILLVAPLSGATDLILLPETFTSGFSNEAIHNAETMDGPTGAWLRAQARSAYQAYQATRYDVAGRILPGLIRTPSSPLAPRVAALIEKRARH